MSEVPGHFGGTSWLVWILCAVSGAWALEAEPSNRPAEPVEISQFGQRFSEKACVGFEWNNPRDIHEIHIEGVNVQEISEMQVQWWASVWPAHGSGGWMQLDDPWNGRWVTVAPIAQIGEPNGHVLVFPPLEKGEWDKSPDGKEYPAGRVPRFRRTLKLRLCHDDPVVLSKMRWHVYGDSRWAEAKFLIEIRSSTGGSVHGRIDPINGVLLGLEPADRAEGLAVNANTWAADCVPADSVRVIATVLYVENADLNSNDLTRITIRLGPEGKARGFSFLPQDVLQGRVVRMPDFGTIISDARRRITLAGDPGPTADHWRKPVRKRLVERPEMTYEAALEGIPRLSPPPWVPLGVPSARQEFFVGPKGDWMISALSLNTDNGRDAKRWMFKKEFGNERQFDEFYAVLDTQSPPKFDGSDRQEARRWLEEGHLPLMHVEWKTGSIRYQHDLITTVLTGEYGDDVTRRGDETVVLLTKLTVENTGIDSEDAFVHLRFSRNAPLRLSDAGLIYVDVKPDLPENEALTALWGQIQPTQSSAGTADEWTLQPGDDPKHSSVLSWTYRLAPGQERAIYFKMPFVQWLDNRELNALSAIQYERQKPMILQYWRDRLAGKMIIETPNKALNDFYRANLWHNIITTDRDPLTGLYNQGVGTVQYRVFANETVMIARSMDMRGESLEAERFLEPMVHYQGHEPLKGRFSTKQGVFHSAGEYTHGEYAMNHGFVLWGLADHYLFTRDRAYLERVADSLIEGCEFLIRERQATKALGPKSHNPVYGLAPASSLEDVVEYQYWFATNAYFYLGLKRAGQALADVNHPDAGRIAAEAEQYRRDIENCLRCATECSAVVPLCDGTYIPYVPSRVHQWRHLTEGWIREALYCSLHTAAAEVIAPSDPLITWMLDDLEDNIFFSWQSGYNVSDYEQTWFEKGGMTLQPCLLDMPIVYMARDEIKACLRAFWNTYALSIHPDVNCFAEWARRFGVPGGPVYKTSDESRFVMWLRQLILYEDGRTLWFGRGLPSQWLQDGKKVRIENAVTLFGLADLEIESHVETGQIHARLRIPDRNPPETVWLRLRHPDGLTPRKVEVNGKSLDQTHLFGEDIELTREVWPETRVAHILATY